MELYIANLNHKIEQADKLQLEEHRIMDKLEATLHRRSFSSVTILDISFPDVLFSEITDFCCSLVMVEEFIVHDVAIIIVSKYVQLLRAYGRCYFNDMYAKWSVSYENVRTFKRSIPQIKDNFGVDYEVYPMLYVYRLVRHMHNIVMRKLRNCHRVNNQNGVTYDLNYVVEMAWNMGDFVIHKVEVHDSTMKLRAHDYNNGRRHFITINSIAKYMNLLEALS